MLTEKEWLSGYEKEIGYQQHMIENLCRWFNLMFLIASIGVVIIYFFFNKSAIGLTIGILVTLLGLLAMLVFGYGIHRGRLNVQKLVDDFENKRRSLRQDS